jgi:hypothetical protein
MMDADELNHFKKIGCTQMLLGQPVMSYDAPYVTLAFKCAPRAVDYKRFQHACWEPYGHMGQNTLPLNIEHRHFVEVTFKRTEATAVVPVAY